MECQERFRMGPRTGHNIQHRWSAEEHGRASSEEELRVLMHVLLDLPYLHDVVVEGYHGNTCTVECLENLAARKTFNLTFWAMCVIRNLVLVPHWLPGDKNKMAYDLSR